MLLIDSFDKEDSFAILSIYQEGLNSGIATFETEVPSWEEWDRKHIKRCRLCVKKDSKIIGWAALSPVSNRPVYQGVAELSVYISQNFQKQGFGEKLVHALIEESKKEGFWTLQSSIFNQNKASIRLHNKCGFREVGYRERIAQRNGIWFTTILMERRNDIC